MDRTHNRKVIGCTLINVFIYLTQEELTNAKYHLSRQRNESNQPSWIEYWVRFKISGLLLIKDFRHLKVQQQKNCDYIKQYEDTSPSTSVYNKDNSLSQKFRQKIPPS